MAEKQSSRDRLKEITASIEDGIKELFQSESYAQYLQTMSRFHHYSVNNQVLIHMQKPDATLVAGFNKWKNQFGRNVIKGEHGIKIIAPTPFKKKIEQEKLDPDTQLPMLDADGKIITEEKTIQIPMYKPVTVFDVSQTEGRPLPQLAHDLSGNVANYDVFMEALRRSSPVPISIEVMGGGMDGYFDLEHQDIAIRKGMSEVQTVSAVIHEMAHALLHNRTKDTEEKTPELSRSTEEVQAESISYAVCAYYGIATGDNSFGYIASWSKDKTLPELRESLEVISKTADGLINDIDRHYAEILKEREAELIAAEPAMAMERLYAVDGKCPRCGGPVTESKTGFFCERRDCRFGLWKDNRYLSAKHIILTKKMAEALLKDGKTFVSGMYSEKTGKSYSAYLVLTDDGQKSSYALEFDREKTGA